MSWSLGRFGNEIAGASFYYSDGAENAGERVIDLQPGTYDLSVSGNGFYTGTATFRLVDVATAAALIPGQPAAGSLDPSNETARYRFDAVSGERFYLANLLSTPNTSLRIVDPHGKQSAHTANIT